eukprot:gene375-3724_t
MGRKRGAKQRQREAERRRQLQQHGVTVVSNGVGALKKKLGQKVRAKKAAAYVANTSGSTNPFAAKRNAGKSIKIRQKTLLGDYQSRNKSTVFADRRLGEHNSQLASEERALLRLARERAKSFRGKGKFNIDLDSDGYDFHERTELLPSDDDEYLEEEEGPLDPDELERMAKFGGMMMKRDAAERVQMFAEERASQPQQSDPLDELKALDTEYTELEQQVVKEANIAVKSGRIISSNNISDFDMLVKEMHTSAKQQASDPVKTQEERDRAYQRKLERLEKERIRRMENDSSVLNDEDDEGIFDVPSTTKLSAKKGKHSNLHKPLTSAMTQTSPDEEYSKLSLPILLTKHLMAIPSGASKRETLERRLNLIWKAIDEYISDSKGTDLAPLNRATRTLFEITQAIPRASALWARKWCESLQAQLETKSKPNFPRLNHLLVLQLLPILFPATDFRHPVMTPIFLLMSCLLTSCSVDSLRNIAAVVICLEFVGSATFHQDSDDVMGFILAVTNRGSDLGLYISTCYVEAVRESKRYVPEVISFLIGTLMLSNSKRLPLSKRNLLAYSKDAKLSNCPSKLKLSWLQSGVPEEELDVAKHQLLFCALRLMSSILSIYEPYPEDMRGLSKRIREKLEDMTKTPRIHLQLQAHKPVPLPELLPDFEEVFIDRKGRKMGKEERTTAKLQHKFKQERKGAIKELRKDTKFLAHVRLQEQKEKDMERFQKVREIENLMAESRREEKEINKSKRKK